MHVFGSPAEVPAGFGPSAVTIGKFDGVHLGHRAVIAQLRELADERGLTASVVTFDRNPVSLLRPEACPPDVVSPAQKVELLADAGVDATLVLRFDLARSRQTASDFVRDVLVDALHAQAVLCGADFRFGVGGSGDVELLRTLGAELGFAVVLIDDVRADGEAGRVSSTRIRELIAAGRVREAGRLLGRPPAVRSVVVSGDRVGRELGYPTANLDPARLEGLLPADGVYACWAIVDGVGYGAAVSIGNNPTFDGVPEHQAEAHLFDTDQDLYGRTIELRFVEHVRPMVKFDGVEQLMAALRQDDATIRGILR
ncbi:bifunctional riboflavin kinase/FAD synthetase [Pseudolysinimonas kribbensis]|uniref:Riboflavin biosynthesis protein n=1 Tax=Pseudolysinimonas kribbensis TaxID=433641 RepID=A0ABQ6KAP4_9MICO|nr:bifunctional riboflavin kinase/FAD synthetase [Pseudolysinimonas kribbensis]GMA96620.1 riboflavin biosynthesis protein [Pseudolysinimonas kribbensis]